ncbi:hypothetical protein [Metamycoplasma buccale]|uniref:hypothetical protein n=1 Tax=Metamycoplasma buccale TaxID=55602 RepID=UPI00398F2F20
MYPNNEIPNQVEYKSTKEMFEANNKAKYLIWFVLFGIMLFVMLILQLTGYLHLIIKRDDYLKMYEDYFINEKASNPASFANIKFRNNVISGTFITLVFLATIILYFISFIKCLIKKDYSQHSMILTFSLPIVFIFILLNFLFSGSGYWNIQSKDVAKIISIVNSTLFLISYLAFYLQIRRIVRKFALLKAYLAAQQANNMDINNSSFDTMFNQVYMNSENNVVTNAPQTSKSNLYRQKLELLDDAQLKAMAEKLSIYGSAEFSREQLIDKIALIFEEKEMKTSFAQNNENDNKTTEENKKDNNDLNKNDKDIN